MNQPIVRVGAAVAAMTIGAAAVAAGPTPISSDRGALRAALSGYITAVSAPGHMDQITINTRRAVLDALAQLAEVTTPAALMASGGVDMPCAVSGNLRASMASTWPRTVRFEWVDCASNPDAPLATTRGPAEVVLAGNSFTAPTALSLRLGDRTRDLVTDAPITDNPLTGGGSSRSNIRMTGLIPIRDRDPTLSRFIGSYVYEVTGFVQETTLVRDRPNPGPPFYPQVLTYAAEHVVDAGEVSGDNAGLRRNSRLLSGVISFHNYRAPTPTRPVRDLRESYRPRDLRTSYTFEYGDPARSSFTVDGKAEVYLAESYGFPGCTAAETYQWKTRAAMTTEAVVADLLDAGELVINNDAVAAFHVTGTDPFDTQQHVELEVRGLGTFTFSQPFSILDMIGLAGCTP
jgi:hypothetical protein